MSKNVYIDNLADVVNEYNNTYTAIKMKPAYINSRAYIEFAVENNDKDPKFEVDIHVRKFKYENIFRNRKIESTVPRTYVIKSLNVEEIVGTFYEK